MTSTKCHRCGQYWSFNSGNPDLFRAITRFCPRCIPLMLPVMGAAPISRRTV